MVKTAHAFAFIALGWFMQMLPALFPAQFPATMTGSTSALWVKFMGWINLMFGVLFVLNLQVLPFLARVMAWRPAPQFARAKAAAARVPGTILRPALRLEAKVVAAVAARRQPESVPVRVNERIVA